MLRKLQELRKQEGGNVLVLAAFCMPLLVGAAGVATDTTMWALWKRETQRAADSAAFAGALTIQQDEFQANAAVRHDFRKSKAFRELGGQIFIELPPRVGPFSGDRNAVRVRVQVQELLPFSNFFLRRVPIVESSATAALVQGQENCLHALESGATPGIALGGSSSARLDCAVMSNSPFRNSVTTGGSASLNAPQVAGAGGVSGSFGSTTRILQHQTPLPDPFRNVREPNAPGSCGPALNVGTNDVVTVVPGCYSGMSLSGTVYFTPGVYFVKGNNFDVGSTANLQGSGVTFLLLPSSGSHPSYPKVGMTGSPTLNLSAPSDGDYRNILFFQSRSAPANQSNSFLGNANSTLAGGLYFPNQQISFSGNAGMTMGCFKMVARRITMTGNFHIRNSCPAPDNRFFGSGVRLVA